MGVVFLSWDSKNFGFKVGDLKLDNVPTKDQLYKYVFQANNDQYELLYLKQIELPPEYLSDSLILADQKVIFEQVVSNIKDEHNSSIISLTGSTTSVDLFSLALQSGAYSRYYLDKKMPLHVFISLYKAWIDNSLNKTIATDVLAYMNNGKPVGFLSYKIDGSFASIGLIAVDSFYLGHGIGTKLISSLISRLPIGTKLQVATQFNNIKACTFYRKNGFSLIKQINIYHLWVKDYIDELKKY